MCEQTVNPTARNTRRRTCGFRVSAADGAVIVVAGAATWLLWDSLGDMALLLPVVLGHFFLFCNVFRVRRRFELLWAIAFIVNVAAWLFVGAFTWPNVLLSQSPLTALLIAAEVRSTRYHGVGWRWINPGCCSVEPEGGQAP